MFEKEIERAAAEAAEHARQRQREQAVAASTVSQSHRLSLRATLLQTDPGPTEAAGAALLPTHVLTFLSGMVVSVTRSRSLYRCWVGADGAGGVCAPAVRTDQMHAQRESAGRRLYSVCTADRALLRHVLRSILCSFTFVNFSSYFPMLFDPGVALWLCGRVIVCRSQFTTRTNATCQTGQARTNRTRAVRGNGQHMWTFFTAGARYERHVRARPLALTRRDAIANPHMDGTTRVCPDPAEHHKPVSCPHHVCRFATTERPGERGQTSELEGVRGWLALWNAALPLLTGAPRLVTGCRTAARIRMRRCYGRG